MTIAPSRQLAEALVDRRLITPDDLMIVQAQADAAGGDVLQMLISTGRVRRVDALRTLAESLEVELFDPATGFLPDPAAIGRLDATIAVSEGALPIRQTQDVLTVAVADPLDAAKRDRLQVASHMTVDMALAPADELEALVRRVYLAQQVTVAADPDAPTPIGIAAQAAPAEATYHINDLLLILMDLGGSDLHLSAGAPPLVRLNGKLMPIEGYDKLRPAELRAMVYDILSARQREELEEKLELDASHPVAGRGRFRTNVFFQRGSVGVVMRAIPNRIAPLSELGMPPVVAELAMKPRGLVLVTGSTGTGKSTTLAAMIDLINAERSLHIMTVEDPIEFMHSHRASVVNQREVGADTTSFSAALLHALRQDPDVILVGEMRDLETMSTALTAAETGHLVLATLHTHTAAGSIERIIDVFPPYQQHQVRVQLAETLQGVVSQQLLPTVDGRGRIPAVEVMIATPAIRNLIRENKVPQIKSAMQAGGKFGMQTMDKALSDLARSGMIDMGVASERAESPEDFMNLLGGVGR
jgi:twitching motility protein PilT